MRHAAFLLVISSFLLTAEVTVLRLLEDRVSHGQVLLFRSAAQVVLTTLWVSRVGLVGLRTNRPGAHFLRGALSAASWWLYYMNFRTLDLALATTLSFSTQIFVVALAWPLLGERVTGHRLAATLLGFLGVFVAAGAWNIETFDTRAVYGLGSAFLGAIMVVITRSLSQTERSGAIMFYMGLTVFAAALPQAWLAWRPLAPGDLLLLMLMGCLGTSATWFMVEAYKRAEASALAPYPYTRLVFSAAAGVLIFGESVAARTFVGAGLIIASSLYLVASESRRSKRAPASPVARARDA